MATHAELMAHIRARHIVEQESKRQFYMRFSPYPPSSAPDEVRYITGRAVHAVLNQIADNCWPAS